MRTSINVLGDAYGCGIVEHLSKAELKKLDEDAEQEFSKTLSITDNLAKNETQFVENTPTIPNPSISIWNETDQQLSDFEGRESANKSTTGALYEPSQQSDQETTLQQNVPSIIVAEASKRDSKRHLFNKTKLPTSINSMPHISQYSSNNNNDKNNGGNQDSNV